jgi:type III secretion system YscD/HrpQ family protein
MAAKLVVEEGALAGFTLSFDEGEQWIIGRDPDESQLIIQDPLVSRKHLIMRKTLAGFVIENLSTINPVLINEKEMSDRPYLLKANDHVQIGQTLFRYVDEQLDSLNSPDASLPLEEDLKDLTLPTESPIQAPEQFVQQEEQEVANHTLWEEKEGETPSFAEINFNVIEMGRWLLKVIGGPNNGAEFYMQADQTYTLGNDPQNCEIVFHDNSVSRQHAKISVTSEDTLLIEDLKSRNGVLIDGVKVEDKQPLPLNTIVNLGTTSFVVYDREGEMQTIISPLLPSIARMLQQEPTPVETSAPIIEPLVEPKKEPSPQLPPKKKSIGPLLFFSALIGMFLLVGLGMTSLFKPQPVIMENNENANELIQQAINPFPAVRFTFNKPTGGLLLIGHVATSSDKTQLLYNLQGLKFIKSIDDSGLVIDEYVWQELNSILSKTPAWKGISIHSPQAGQFILSGYLQTRKQAEQLSSYVSLNFPYLDLLKKEVLVEEDVVNQIQSWLQDASLTKVIAKMSNGEVTLTGAAFQTQGEEISQIIAKIKKIPGVRIVNNFVTLQTADVGVVNISNQYQVSGKSRIGDKYTVVINGRILSEGDSLDGMEIKKITGDYTLLQKGDTKYRIDY